MTRVLLTGSTYGTLPENTARLQLWARAVTAGSASYTRLLLTGATYGATGGAGIWRPARWGTARTGTGGVSARLGAWSANRIIDMYRKNTAGQNLAFVVLNAATGGGMTGAAVSGYRSIDGGAQSAVTGSITELANGQYNLALSAAGTNGNHIGFLFTAAGAVPVQIAIVTTVDDPATGTAAAVWGHAVEAGWSALEATRVMLSALAGKVSGANTTSIAFRDVGDSKNRISATVDQYGNRNVVTIDKT